jgi:hypothetical protein
MCDWHKSTAQALAYQLFELEIVGVGGVLPCSQLNSSATGKLLSPSEALSASKLL